MDGKLMYISIDDNLITHSAFEGALTFVSEPKLGHSAFHYPRLGNFISLFNKI
jgi:hypothetical protein